MKRLTQYTLFSLLLVLLGGCVQEVTNRSIGLGDVTLGQQLIDLQRALESDAIDEEEFEQIKKNLIASAAMCSEGVVPSDAEAEAEAEEEEDSFWF